MKFVMQKILKRGLGIALALSIAGAVSPLSQAADQPLVPVVAATNPIQDISKATLRRAFSGEPTSGPGGKLIPLNQPPGTPARSEFDKAILGLDPEGVTKFWIDQRIRGQGAAPRAVPSAMLMRVVPQLAGAITYLRANEVTAGLKALTVDGKKSSDPGYLLK